MLQVKKIVGRTLSSNMYMLFEESSYNSWVIDIGDYNALKKELPLSAHVKGLFLTHGHFDHIAGINEFHKEFPDSIIYTSEYGKEQLYSDKKNFSLYHEQSMVYEGNNIEVIQEGNTIELFEGHTLNVIETPGHCPSCLTYYTDNYIFTGDSYIQGTNVVTKLPKGNKSLADKSLQKILSISNGKNICSGHDVENWVSYF